MRHYLVNVIQHDTVIPSREISYTGFIQTNIALTDSCVRGADRLDNNPSLGCCHLLLFQHCSVRDIVWFLEQECYSFTAHYKYWIIWWMLSCRVRYAFWYTKTLGRWTVPCYLFSDHTLSWPRIKWPGTISQIRADNIIIIKLKIVTLILAVMLTSM